MGFDPIENIFQIALSEPESAPPKCSKALEKNIRSFRRIYRKSNYHLIDGRAARKFLGSHFGDQVLQCYERMRPMAFRADLLRYCLLYQRGGLYSDLSHFHLRKLRVPSGTEMVLFRDIAHHPDHAVSNGLMYSRPGTVELKETIRRIVAHCESRFYGTCALEPTGPYLLGEVVRDVGAKSLISMGSSRPFKPRALSRWFRRIHRVHVQKITADGRVVAEKRKAKNADISEFLGGGGNDYGAIWNRRQVWGEQSVVYPATDAILCAGHGVFRGPEGLRIEAGQDSVRISGPEIPISAGNILVELKLSNIGSGGALNVGFSGAYGGCLECVPIGRKPEGDRRTMHCSCYVAQACGALVLEVSSDARFSGVVHSIALKGGSVDQY